MALIADAVFNQALNYVKTNGTEGEIQTAAGAILVDNVILNSGNYGVVGDNSGSGGGRKIQAFVSSASDMQNINVNSAGNAAKAAIKDASGFVLIEADLSGSVSLGASDQVNLGTVSIILKDPS